MEPSEGKVSEPLNSGDISTRLARIAELARNHPDRAFRSLHHAIDIDWLGEAYRRTRKDGATGVDGQRAADFAMDLEGNLQSLLDRFRTGAYRAPPVRRVHITKADGRSTRPIGIPTFEDKVLQRAVAMLVEAIYETEFHPGSFGFRPGRSAHDALESLRNGLMSMRGGWVLEVDIKSFFDTLDHGALRLFLDRRVTDGAVRRAIDKWLKAGVLEGEELSRPELGTPQGGVISPLLANIYLHEVLDRWFEADVRPRLRGQAFLVRYADDFVIAFAREDDARKVLDVLPKRLGKYGLTLHPDKTRLVNFTRPSYRDDDPGEGPGSFELLGFNHHWERSLKGYWVVKRTTMRSRFTRAIRAARQWCRLNRHRPVPEQCKALGQKLRGHYSYFGIIGNFEALARFAREVEKAWHKWLCRRSQRSYIPWPQFANLLKRHPLPRPRIVHSRPAAQSANP
jgi:group II intron reverse transcriptase/maturase